MRIDNAKPGQVTTQGAAAARGQAQGRTSSRAQAGAGDAVELSRLGTAVRSLALRIVSDDAAVRALRIQQLKSAIASGQYAPDPEATAEAMLEHVVE
jgi:flagellar biosynthesis anti-sigma factor FlgM